MRGSLASLLARRSRSMASDTRRVTTSIPTSGQPPVRPRPCRYSSPRASADLLLPACLLTSRVAGFTLRSACLPTSTPDLPSFGLPSWARCRCESGSGKETSRQRSPGWRADPKSRWQIALHQAAPENQAGRAPPRVASTIAESALIRGLLLERPSGAPQLPARSQVGGRISVSESDRCSPPLTALSGTQRARPAAPSAERADDCRDG